LSALLLAALSLVAVTAVDPVWADDAPRSASERAQAAKLKRDGDAAMVALRHDEALEAYSQAYEILRDPALLYNRGRALEGLGRFPEALEQLEAFDAQAPAQLKARVPALTELLAEVRARIATLTLSCNIEGARILVGDRVVGTTPLAGPLKLNAGPTQVQVEAEGYIPFRSTVELPGGGALAVDARLSPRSRKGILVVRSSVTGARVTIDGHSVGNVPAETSLSAGTHRILVESDGYIAASMSALIVAGDRKQVDVALNPAQPIVTRWWFWTGIGAVVVAGAVLTSVLLKEGAADEGTIPPRQVSAPFRWGP
jgi:hypothetical protein